MIPITKALSFKTGRDLVLINILSALLILVIFFFPNSPARIILGLPFVLFYTGYVSISALFPREEDLDIIERLTFSVGLSTAIVSLIGLLLNYTPLGIRLYSVAFSLFAFILLLSRVAIYRRKTIIPAFASLAPDRNMGGLDIVEDSNKEVVYEAKSGKFRKIKLEYLALLFFIALSLFCYHQNYFSFIFMMIAAVIGVLLFIIFNKYFTKEQEWTSSFELSEDKARIIRLATTILFLVFYGLSFLTLLQGFYTKTVWYYVFISLCTGVIALEIFFVKTKTQGMINLIKSFLLVLNITLSNQIIFPFGIGMCDLPCHLYMLYPIINTGYIPHIVASYEYFPCHHILAVANILICGSDPKMTYLYLGGFAICLGMLFVFLIGRKGFNVKTGLFAALIYTCLDYLIMHGTHPEHMAYTYFLSIMLFAVILYLYDGEKKITFLYPILVIAMVFTHHYSAMIILIMLLSLMIFEIFQYIKEANYKFKIEVLASLYLVILFTQWMYYSNRLGCFAGIIRAYGGAFAEVGESISAPTIYDQLPITTLFLNTLGSSILILLAVIGVLYVFKKRSLIMNVIIVVAISISILLGIGVVLKCFWLLPDRMYPFLQLFVLVFFASAGIIWLSNIKQNKLTPILIILLIMCLSFFSLSSTIAGFETSLFVDEHTAYHRVYETPQDTHFRQWRVSFVGDNCSVLNNPPVRSDGRVDIQNITKKSFIILNKFHLKTGFVIGTGSHIGSNIFIRIKEDTLYPLERYNRCYDNGVIDLYYKGK